MAANCKFQCRLIARLEVGQLLNAEDRFALIADSVSFHLIAALAAQDAATT